MVHHLQIELPNSGRLTVLDDKLYGLDSTDNVTQYDDIVVVPSRAARDYVAKRAVTVESPDGTVRSCLFAFPSGTGLYETNVCLHGTRLLLASGVAIICVDLTTLHMDWAVDLQTGADNGIHVVSGNRYLAIGDFDATLLDSAGLVIWAHNIPGFLVPPAQIDFRSFTIADDDGFDHCISIDTGQPITG